MKLEIFLQLLAGILVLAAVSVYAHGNSSSARESELGFRANVQHAR